MSATSNPTIEEVEFYGISEQSSSMVMNADSISLEWPNMPGVIYAVQSSTNLANDLFSTTIESGIPSLEEGNRIVVEFPDADTAFYRIIAE